MKLKDIVLNLLKKNLQGVQLFRKEDIPQIIKKFDLIPCNGIDMKEDVLGIFYDDAIMYLNLTWKQEGIKYTLIDISWK
jgi:hypothetical protein